MADIPILSDIFGRKPETVPFKPIDFGESQIKAILENLAAFPNIQKLGSMFQDYMTSAYNKAIPNFSTLLDLGGKNTEAILRAAQPLIEGKIPEDVKGNILRSGAFKGLMSGGGQAFTQSLQARDLGRTTLDLEKMGTDIAGAGANAAQRWAGLASGLIMNPAGFLITPAAQANLDLQQRLIKREVAQQRANVAAAPNPIAKGLSDLVAYLTASYIGRGPAGKPPAAVDYSSQTMVNSAVDTTGQEPYGLSTFGRQSTGGGSPTAGLTKDDWNPPLSPTSLPGDVAFSQGGDQQSQANAATYGYGQVDWGLGPGVVPPSNINTDWFNFNLAPWGDTTQTRTY